ncbi:MAG: MaoC family dehydratase [Pseudomonadota bacterium]
MDNVRSVDDGTAGHFVQDLSVGMSASISRTVTDADIVLFSGITGDTNPIHLNQAYAESTMFKGRIAHGMLTGGLISAVLGTKLPGPGAIYIAQNMSFRAPVRVGDTVTARVTVAEIFPEKSRIKVITQCYVDDKMVVDGDALLMVPSRTSAAA